MAESDWVQVREALATALAKGYRTVELKSGELKFKAVLGAPREQAAVAMGGEDAVGLDWTVPVTSGSVGYFRERGEPLVSGRVVDVGEVLGEVVALGLANEIASPGAGTVDTVLVAAGDVVDFGRVIARIKPS
ncbi:MAG: biotin/lipoyl-containing protein [Fimbriimonadaceae bacterium]